MQDRKCNELCALLEKNNKPQNGVIIHSDLLLDYLQKNYPGLYLVSSTTKVLTNFSDFLQEIDREEFRYVVPDFRLNKKFDQLNQMNTQQDIYLPMGFSNFKIEGRGLGSALILEFLLYYMTRPEYQIHVREKIYLDNMLDLF